MGTDNCISYTARSQALKIRKCIFRAGEQDDICFFYLVDIVRIIGIEARVHIQYVEVGEIRHSFQQDDRHVDFSVPVSIVFHIEGDRIFFFDFDIAKPRNHTYYRHTGQVLDNLPAIVKKRCISPEFIDNDPFHQNSFFRLQKGDCSVNRSENAASVYVGNQKGGRSCLLGHPHIGDVSVAQV